MNLCCMDPPGLWSRFWKRKAKCDWATQQLMYDLHTVSSEYKLLRWILLLLRCTTYDIMVSSWSTVRTSLQTQTSPELIHQQVGPILNTQRDPHTGYLLVLTHRSRLRGSFRFIFLLISSIEGRFLFCYQKIIQDVCIWEITKLYWIHITSVLS